MNDKEEFNTRNKEKKYLVEMPTLCLNKNPAISVQY